MNVHSFRQIDYSISQIDHKWVSGVDCVRPNNKVDKSERNLVCWDLLAFFRTGIVLLYTALSIYTIF